MALEYRNSITPEEVNLLRKGVGFRQIDPEQLSAGLKGSALVVSAYDGGNAAGMARLIWDGGMVAVLTDLLVLPDYQGQPVLRDMVRKILAYLKSKLKPGFGIQVDVHAWGQQEALLRELGFEISVPERRGVPMQLCLTDQIELTDEKFGQCGFLGD